MYCSTDDFKDRGCTHDACLHMALLVRSVQIRFSCNSVTDCVWYTYIIDPAENSNYYAVRDVSAPLASTT